MSRAGNTYHDVNFAVFFVKQAFACQGRTKDHLGAHDIAHDNQLLRFCLAEWAWWMSVLEDIMVGPQVIALHTTALDECVDHEEFMRLSVGKTLRIATRIKGQANRASEEERASCVVGGADAKRRVLTF